MKQEIKRVFLGVEVYAPWPAQMPRGRILDENHRPLTLIFLGNITYLPLYHLLNDFFRAPMKVGRVVRLRPYLVIKG